DVDVDGDGDVNVAVVADLKMMIVAHGHVAVAVAVHAQDHVNVNVDDHVNVNVVGLHAELELPERQPGHPQEQPAMAEAIDLRLPVPPRLVAHRHLDDLQSHPRRAEEQIEIPEGIEI